MRTDAGMLGLKNVNIFLPRSFSEAPMCRTSAPSVSADCNLLKDSAPGIRKESLPRSSPPRVSGTRATDCKSARQIHFLARMPRRLFKSPPHWARSGKIGISGGGSVGQGKSRSSNRKHEPVFRSNRPCSTFCEGYGHKKQGQRRGVVLFGRPLYQFIKLIHKGL